MSLKTFLQTAAKGLNFGGYGGGYGMNDPWGGFYRTLPGSQYDYRREAGIPWENSIVLACVKWACRTFPEAPLVVERKRGDEWEQDTEHEALKLLGKPNPHYSADILWMGAILSDMTDGNGYWYANPSRLGNPTELYYLPHFQVSPRWPSSGQAYVSHYEYRVDAQTTLSLKPEHVVHFRNGVDPQNIRRGLSPLGAVLREICADNEAATASAALMRNMGVVGLTFSPAETEGMSTEQIDKLVQLGQQKFTGERRGEFTVAPIAGKFETVGFSPNQLALDVVRRVPEERVTSALGLPAVVIGFGAGLERSTFANMQEAREMAYESFLVPLWRRMADQMTHVLMPLYGEDPSECRFAFDLTKVKALQENENERNDRIISLYQANVINLNEARTAIGYQKVPQGEKFSAESQADLQPDPQDVVKHIKSLAHSNAQA